MYIIHRTIKAGLHWPISSLLKYFRWKKEPELFNSKIDQIECLPMFKNLQVGAIIYFLSSLEEKPKLSKLFFIYLEKQDIKNLALLFLKLVLF